MSEEDTDYQSGYGAYAAYSPPSDPKGDETHDNPPHFPQAEVDFDYDEPRRDIYGAAKLGLPFEERVAFANAVLLDGSGNFAGSIYDVRQGFKFCPNRLVISDPRNTFTPAAPYSNAAAWVGIFEEEVSTSLSGNLIDFGPTTAGQPIIPSGFVWSKEDGPICFKFLSLRIVSGPANVTLAINGVGILREA